MQFLAQTNIFEGVVQLNSAPTADNHAVTKSYLEANSVVGITTDSANYAELVTVNGEKQLKIKPLTITDVAVDTTAASISAWVTANYTNGDEKQEGDIIVLTAVSGRAETWIHKGGTAGDASDFAEIEGADVTDAEIRGALSASNGVSYNSSTGAFTANTGEIRGFFSAGTGLSYDDANGVYSLNVDTDGISEGTSNLYFTDARARGALSITGSGLSYDSSTGVFELTADSGDISEGSNLYFTDARARGALSLESVAGPDSQMISYNDSTGVLSLKASEIHGLFFAGQGMSFANGEIALDADTDDLTEGSGNLFFTTARVDAHLSGGTGIQYDGGVISFNGDTDDVTEGATNQYFTEARARGAIAADSDPGNMAQYDSATGEILVALSDFRRTFAPQNLTANTFATLNHQLGEKIVHVSAYDSSGNLVQLDVQLVDNNNLKVKSTINVTGAQIVVSL